MFQKSYKILSTEKLNNTTFSFVISCPELAEESWCGRFVNVLCGEKTLRRPISISEIDKQNGTITIVFEVRGDGTKWMSERKAGDELDILGPLGNGFFPDKTKRGIFIGGGIGCPPMLGAAKEYGSDAEVILGFRSKKMQYLQISLSLSLSGWKSQQTTVPSAQKALLPMCLKIWFKTAKMP